MEKYVFISYSNTDRKTADKLRDYFIENNISVWMAPYSIPSSAVYASKINEGISNCSIFLMLLTEKSMNSKHVLNELNLVFNKKCPIFTFKMGDFPLSLDFEYYLGSAQIDEMKRLDFESESFQKAFNHIKKTLGNEDVPVNNDPQKKRFNILNKKKWIISLTTVLIIILSLVGGLICYKKFYKVDTKIELSPVTKNINMGLYKDSIIEWIVLDENENGDKLLLSKNILYLRAYDDTNEEVTWETCSLRKWLNEEFYSTVFDEKEQSKILITNLENEDNPKYRTKGGNSTEDKLFLLSIDEIQTYLSSDKKRVANRLDNGDVWKYWLRSPGYNSLYGACVYRDGLVSVAGANTIDDIGGIRPAMWIHE